MENKAILHNYRRSKRNYLRSSCENWNVIKKKLQVKGIQGLKHDGRQLDTEMDSSNFWEGRWKCCRTFAGISDLYCILGQYISLQVHKRRLYCYITDFYTFGYRFCRLIWQNVGVAAVPERPFLAFHILRSFSLIFDDFSATIEKYRTKNTPI